MVIGSHSYSLKKLEPIFVEEREREGVTNAADSVVEYANYCDLVAEGRLSEAEVKIKQIEDYNAYGVSNKKDVKEDHPLVPLTLYNKYKGMCEPLLFKHTNDNFEGVIFRPATVCGYAPRLRLDLSVNILTNHAVNKNKITVFGGEQLRPNLHVQDYCDAVICLMNAPIEKVRNQIFNIGYQN